ncbi:MAG: hypothetical protein AAFS12_00145 [Cyanobacteria bacterium J06632_19]
MQVKAFDPYKLNVELKRWQPSEDTLKQQEKQLIQILEEREQELRQEKQKVKQENKSNKFKGKKRKVQQATNVNQTIKSGEQAAKVKVETTVKFSELPKAEEAEEKKVKLFFVDDENNSYIALINRKTWNKQCKRIDEIVASEAEWIGAISGKLKVGENEFLIEEAGLQVYEKKKKD